MRFFVYFLSALFIFTTVSSKEFRIDFSDEGMKLLKKRGFGKKTSYTNGKDDKGWYLKAEANDSATGLGMEIEKDLLQEMPFLNIAFKIEKDFEIIDQKTKDGHDWAARVMVGFGKKIIYQEAPETLPPEILKSMKRDIAKRILSERKEKWWTIPTLYTEIDTLREKYTNENDEEKLNLLDEFNNYAMSIQKKYENV